ncbi:MAG: cytochrome o ubiquinol oxidase subunit IV [Pseudoxanthomonas sp.]
MANDIHGQHAHSAHDAVHDAGGHHGSVKSYLVGFGWAVLLTVVPFVLVMTGFFPAAFTAVLIALLALAQIVVHLVFFLHLDSSSRQRWNVLVGLFTVVIIGIVVIGSLWVLYNMNVNMMH